MDEPDQIEPQPPPVLESEAEKPAGPNKKGLAGLGALGVIVLTKLKAIGAFILPALKFLKLGKILTTSGSMLLSTWFYSLMFGWWFAAGIVVLIFVHEMGHVYVAWRQGLPISAPIFIPGMGAVILAKQEGKSAWNEALMGIGGPIAGTLGALVCWAVYSVTGNEMFLGLAFFGFLINLFNLMPVFPLDGGWITGAISPYLWLIGLAGLAFMFFAGSLRNPMILILLLLSLPRLWHGLRTGVAHGPDVLPATGNQKWIIGVSYLALAGFLVWAMMDTHVDRTPTSEPTPVGQAA